MHDSLLALADRNLADSVTQLRLVSDTTGDEELLGVLFLCERVTRELEQTTLAAIGHLEARGVFAAHGYSRSAVFATGQISARHHRLLHHLGWTVCIRDRHPEFTPPTWIDPQCTPRQKPLLT